MRGGEERCSPATVVVKLGGSVLTDDNAFARAARFLCERVRRARGESYVAVVSAQEGWTDSLERTARGIARFPSPRSLDLLWSTGEIRSVALLALHLERLGVRAVGLNVAETGLRLDEAAGNRIALDSGRLRAELAENEIAVVPGFLGTNAEGTIVTLGRGGSDLTAVLLAIGLEAARCELVKDVPGYFSADPHRDAGAKQLPALTFREALELADHGCDLVQRNAIEAAARAGLPVVVHSLQEADLVSIVSAGGEGGVARSATAGAQGLIPTTVSAYEASDRNALTTIQPKERRK